MLTIWQYRELIRNLTSADLKNRYQNTVLGFFWSLLSPLLLAGVLYFVFRNMFGQGPNFAVNLLVGLTAWRFFANGTTASLNAILGKASLVTKVYVPRQILVLSTVFTYLISSLLEFAVTLPIVYIVIKNVPITLLLFPLVHFLFLLFILGCGLVLAALYVYLRDLNQIWEVLTSILLFCSPIIYPLALVPITWRHYYMLNPITQFVIAFQKIVVAGEVPGLSSVLIMFAAALVAYIAGSLIFNRLQRRFAEEI